MSGNGRLKYLEKRAELIMEEIEKETARQALVAELGSNSDYADGTIISWEQQYDKNGIVYTFVALKIAGAWYTTSLFQNSRWTWDKLVEDHLSKALEQGRDIFLVTKMEAI